MNRGGGMKKRFQKSDDIPEPTHYLANIDVDEVTLTGYPAVPRAKFKIKKSNGEEVESEGVTVFHKSLPEGKKPNFTKDFKIAKVDAAEQNVFAFCLFKDEGDYHGDLVTDNEVIKACHSFLRNMAFGQQVGTGTGYEHKKFADIGYPIESCIDYDGSIGKSVGMDNTAGAWWLGVHVTNSEVWKKVEDGEVTGFSIAGYAERVPIDSKSIARRVVDRLKSVVKGDGDAQTYAEVKTDEEIRSQVWDMVWRLGDSLRSIISDDTVTDKKAMAEESFKQAFNDIMAVIASISTASTQQADIFANSLKSIRSEIDELIGKAGEHPTGGNDVDEKQVKAIVTEVVEAVKTELTTAVDDKLTKALAGLDEKFEKKAEPPKGDTPPAEDPVVKSLDDIKAQIGDVSKRLEAIEKSPGSRNGADPEGDPEVKKDRSKMTVLERSVDSTKGTPMSLRS